MADFFDYLKWRGDLSFSASEFNDIDALIFCQLSYANFEGLVPKTFDKSISLKALAKKFKEDPNFSKRVKLGLVINPKTIDLLFAAAESERFSTARLCGLKNIFNEEAGEQFYAMTVILPNLIFVAFRGTDDTITGWKEDFNLAFEEAVPAQTDALAYLENLKTELKAEKFSVGGHSKGGNLAIYSSAHFSNQNAIESVYNFDGPGFLEKELKKENFLCIKPKIRTFYPDFSIVGMLFHHFEDFTVVQNSQKFIMQHDPFSWQILGNHFEIQAKLSDGSKFLYKIFNSWFEKLTKQERTEFISTLFNAIESSNVKDFSSFAEHLGRNLIRVLKAFDSNDKSIKKSVRNIITEFLKTTGEAFGESLMENSSYKNLTESVTKKRPSLKDQISNL